MFIFFIFTPEKVTEDFMKFRLGSRTTRKDRDNAAQASSHVSRFCYYMAAGLPSSAVFHDLRFLLQMDKLRAWPTYLTHKGYAPTSIKNMLNNVTMFLKHIENSYQKASKIKQKDFTQLHYEIKRIASEVQRKVVVHGQKVLSRKTDDQLLAHDQMQFMKAARKKIPKLLEDLSRQTHEKEQHSKLMGYIMGYLAMLTGHRSVVLTNMTKEAVVKFESWNHGERFHILVDEHETVQAFGQASLALNSEEFSWLEALTNGKCCDHGKRSKRTDTCLKRNASRWQKPCATIQLQLTSFMWLCLTKLWHMKLGC
ncbi:uncharacterized protein LOC121957188 isoform X3 [Plectropomus leopardus]|uniref:uncharacterized protein LOC121957188 isoform X3 n=1 Tax=Plectropomus leopardus TaxID=160734 RepID=UPI001C4B7239|nr:uncharacterized protein LOC121957188 isoform X3 [Plectropomus leopardus]